MLLKMQSAACFKAHAAVSSLLQEPQGHEGTHVGPAPHGTPRGVPAVTLGTGPAPLLGRLLEQGRRLRVHIAEGVHERLVERPADDCAAGK